MPTTIEAIETAIGEATAAGFRGRLIARGQARAMIWRDGLLPAGAPAFSELLSYDLHSYAYSLLLMGLRLSELNGNQAVARQAFEQAASALESVIVRGVPNAVDHDFHLVMTAAAYHLARLSARAYSILAPIRAEENYSLTEKALAFLMLRDLRALDALITPRVGTNGDATIAATYAAELAELEQYDEERDPSSFLFDGLDNALSEEFFRALAIFLLGLERGEAPLKDAALARLQTGVEICEALNLVPQWWTHRIAIHLLRDIWDTSFHERLPPQLEGEDGARWAELRRQFLAVLICRNKAEIELWPSQLAAAARAVDPHDDLVVSLPTSAGKTRIAELCILRTLAANKRVVFITPLRALSAQTEAGLQRSFGPLGKTISALYGSIGVTGFDQDAIRTRHIVVATPEKLDFALRNDPSLLDDVGLLVFDEGHMIGVDEREVRYEVQIQRLLRRADAQTRRIVCLSAILPDGQELEDFANWLCRDSGGDVIRSTWRPTRLRFGEVVWNNGSARLNLRVNDEQPFVPRFLTGFVPPIGRRKKLFPNDLGELCLATAWRLVGDGQSVLIFCPVRAHVEPFADRIVELNKRGALRSLLAVPEAELAIALALGAEWLGVDHPILKCLKLGIAIHHGALPTAYRKEIERLLRDNVLKVTISSPTLAQGLNLSATVVVMHSLFRNRERIPVSEFKNVIGRAGRAYVDVEGLVLYPIFDRYADRIDQWQTLIDDVSFRDMESGLLRLMVTLMRRMNECLGRPPIQQLADYVLNNHQAWNFPTLYGEDAETRERERANWERYVATLDTAILSLVGDADVADADVAAALDTVLQSSLWQRRLARREEALRAILHSGLVSRAHYIWQNSDTVRRRGYFLAGVGLRTGHGLDALALEGNRLLVAANIHLSTGDIAQAITAITSLAERAFSLPPFLPDKLPDNWHEILDAWLRGEPLANLAAGQEAETLQFVEQGLVYKLPWAMEALRVRGLTHNDAIGDFGFTLADFDLSYAVSAVETGTPNRAAALLIQAGFNSRLAAIKAVGDTGGAFGNGDELRQWLQSPAVAAAASDPAWPTPATHDLWREFARSFDRHGASVWKEHRYWAPADWIVGRRPAVGTPLRITKTEPHHSIVAPDGMLVGHCPSPFNLARKGLLRVAVDSNPDRISLSYLGPDDLWSI